MSRPYQYTILNKPTFRRIWRIEIIFNIKELLLNFKCDNYILVLLKSPNHLNTEVYTDEIIQCLGFALKNKCRDKLCSWIGRYNKNSPQFDLS